jgi:hypothetical protein
MRQLNERHWESGKDMINAFTDKKCKGILKKKILVTLRTAM